MIEKFRNQLFSENGMKIINVLFFLSFIFTNPFLIIGTFVVWIAFLIYSIRKTSSSVMRVVYSLLGIFAVVIVVMNVYSIIR